jgi:hypothetical protein
MTKRWGKMKIWVYKRVECQAEKEKEPVKDSFAMPAMKTVVAEIGAAGQT